VALLHVFGLNLRGNADNELDLDKCDHRLADLQRFRVLGASRHFMDNRPAVCVDLVGAETLSFP